MGRSRPVIGSRVPQPLSRTPDRLPKSRRAYRLEQIHSYAMKMPDGDAAIVDGQKLTGYCLNPEHPRGKHKARVFATLGFTAENADALRAALLMAAASGDAQPAASDQFGDRYVLEFEIEGPRAKGIVRSMWIVRRGERAPRLTSCFVK